MCVYLSVCPSHFFLMSLTVLATLSILLLCLSCLHFSISDSVPLILISGAAALPLAHLLPLLSPHLSSTL